METSYTYLQTDQLLSTSTKSMVDIDRTDQKAAYFEIEIDGRNIFTCCELLLWITSSSTKDISVTTEQGNWWVTNY